MKQLQFYKYATWGLLVLNLSMIAFFFLTRPEPPLPHSAKSFLPQAIEMLHLDEQQRAAFEQSARAHNQEMNSINEQQQELLLPYFQSLADSSKSIDTEKLVSQIQRLEGDKVESTYRHFQSVKSILRPEQQAFFEAFMNHALRIILLEQKNPPPPPKGR